MRLTELPAIRKASCDHPRSPATPQERRRRWPRSTEGMGSKFHPTFLPRLSPIPRKCISVHHIMSTLFNNQRMYQPGESRTDDWCLKAANEALMKNLKRENSMIATAWYDLSSRLQSNHLVLQRRQDMPKSWLSKQRMVVNATPRR